MTGSPPAIETDPRTRTLQRLALGAAIVVAILVRVLFLDTKPFWRDEAWVALLVNDPSLAITGGRAAPFGFLWLTKLASMLVPGPREVSYRLVPLLVGIVIVPLVARMATRFGAGRWVAVSAAWMAVGLVPLVYYSRELKSYDIDLAIAILAPMLALASWDRTRASAATRVALLALLVATPWISFAGVFPVAAVLAWAWLARAPRATWDRRRDLLLSSLAFTLSFAAAYFVAIAPQASNPYLLSYWQGHMLGRAEIPLWNKISQGVSDYLRLSATYFFGDLWKPVLATALIGAVTWPRPHRLLLLWMYAVTAASCLAATLTDHYLIAHGRHLLFSLPPLLLWTAQGLWTLARPLGARLRPAFTVALPVVFAVFFSVESVGKRLDPYHTNQADFFRYDTLQNVDEAIAATQALVGPHDAVIFSWRTSYPFQFYRDGRLPEADYCQIACDWPHTASEWLGAVPDRAWLVLADEEIRQIREFLGTTSFSYRERLSLRGVRVWELQRTACDWTQDCWTSRKPR